MGHFFPYKQFISLCREICACVFFLTDWRKTFDKKRNKNRRQVNQYIIKKTKIKRTKTVHDATHVKNSTVSEVEVITCSKDKGKKCFR